MEKNSAMTSFMITFTSIIWIFSLLCKDIWSLHYIVFFVDFFRITVIKVWLLLVRGSTGRREMIICAMRESCFLDSVLLMYLSISLPWVEKSLMKKVSSHLHTKQVLFFSKSFRPRRNPKFLSGKASFDIFFQYRLYYTACLAVIWVFWSPW